MAIIPNLREENLNLSLSSQVQWSGKPFLVSAFFSSFSQQETGREGEKPSYMVHINFKSP